MGLRANLTSSLLAVALNQGSRVLLIQDLAGYTKQMADAATGLRLRQPLRRTQALN